MSTTNKKEEETRIYLPRSTVPMSTTITIDQVAKELNIAKGRAIELMLLESPTFNKKLDELRRETPWMS